MIRFWKRDLQTEQDFLDSPDISVCPKCDAFLNWHIWGTGRDHDLIKGCLCTECGWLCGTAKLKDLIFALYWEKIGVKFRMAYRRVGYFEQTYYIIAAWLRGLLHKK